jgi:thiamine transporter ThiT
VTKVVSTSSKVSSIIISSIKVSAIIVSAVPVAISIEATVVSIVRIGIRRGTNVGMVVGVAARIPDYITVIRRRRINRSHADSYNDSGVRRRWTC